MQPYASDDGARSTWAGTVDEMDDHTVFDALEGPDLTVGHRVAYASAPWCTEADGSRRIRRWAYSVTT